VVRPTWQEYFLTIADAVSTRADCVRRKVGCVIVDEDHRILATGYNGSAPGGPSCLAGECPRGGKTYQQQPGLVGGYEDCVATHAEANALLFARASCKGATVYITDPPCTGCMKLMRSAGVEQVIYRNENGQSVLMKVRSGLVG
jgi:dCMP deaminase